MSNSVDFQNSSQFKNKLIIKSDDNKQNNNNLNFNRNLENEKKMKNFIEGELANSLIKENISYPLSPQNQKSNILKNYVNKFIKIYQNFYFYLNLNF